MNEISLPYLSEQHHRRLIAEFIPTLAAMLAEASPSLPMMLAEAGPSTGDR